MQLAGASLSDALAAGFAAHVLGGACEVLASLHVLLAAAMSAAIAMAEVAAQNVIDLFAGELKDEMTFNLEGLQKP